MGPRKHNYIAVLDIGSFKISCFIIRAPIDISSIAEEQRISSISIVGTSELPSRGIKAGTIHNMQVAEGVIDSVIKNAEIDASQTVDHVWINSSAGNPKISYYNHEKACDGFISQNIIDKLYDHTVEDIYKKHDYIVHALPLQYMVDTAEPVSNPLGMRGHKITMDSMAITADLPPLRNLGLALERCHVEIGGRALSPYASALGCLVPSEMETGAICIDLGADTTTLSAYKNNQLVFADILKIGGSNITRDIAQYFSIPLASAENLKCSKGTCNIFGTEHDKIQIPVIGENSSTPTFETISRAELAKIIRARTEEILEKCVQRLQETGLMNTYYKIIFTGGSAQLNGLEALAQKILGTKPRIACPIRLPSMPQTMSGTAYSVLAGLVHYAILPHNEIPPEKLFKRNSNEENSVLKKMFHWLKYNF